jgi:hypothetical protein
MVELILKGGPLMWPIIFCSVVMLGITLKKWIDIHIASGQLDTPIEDLVKRRPQIMAPVLDAIENGHGEEEIALIGSRQLRNLQRGLRVLSLVAVICPLFGLTGTVPAVFSDVHGGLVFVPDLPGGLFLALGAGLFRLGAQHLGLGLFGKLVLNVRGDATDMENRGFEFRRRDFHRRRLCFCRHVVFSFFQVAFQAVNELGGLTSLQCLALSRLARPCLALARRAKPG